MKRIIFLFILILAFRPGTMSEINKPPGSLNNKKVKVAELIGEWSICHAYRKSGDTMFEISYFTCPRIIFINIDSGKIILANKIEPFGWKLKNDSINFNYSTDDPFLNGRQFVIKTIKKRRSKVLELRTGNFYYILAK